jgi:hypothetical protein
MNRISTLIREVEEAIARLASLRGQIDREVERQAEQAKGKDQAAKRRKVMQELAKPDRDVVRNFDRFVELKFWPDRAVQKDKAQDAADINDTIKEGQAFLGRPIKTAPRLPLPATETGKINIIILQKQN